MLLAFLSSGSIAHVKMSSFLNNTAKVSTHVPCLGTFMRDVVDVCSAFLLLLNSSMCSRTGLYQERLTISPFE